MADEKDLEPIEIDAIDAYLSGQGPPVEVYEGAPTIDRVPTPQAKRIAELGVEVARLSTSVCDWREKYNRQAARLLEAETRASKRNVARLEAEVAELSELVEDMKARNESKLSQAVDALQDSILGRIPRRTPELAERVAELLDGVEVRNIEGGRCVAGMVLDLVFGKERE